ncbi:MAG TPA: porphobilinogen synthase [Candidatus Avanaerovorax faecigallinarum]|nr:porphobilinogen synthase [Candidatus Avanaerovorax faecigallinarum]
MIIRPRRLRSGEIVRGMVRETRVSKDSLIYPIFFEEGKNIKTPIDAMDGQFRYSPDRAKEIIDRCLSHGVNKVLLFGIPKEKDEKGSQAYAENGIVQQAVRAIKEEYGDSVYVVTDVCMCEYTSHGHCGILCGHDVDNDETLKYLTATAVSHAEAGADMVAPSDMMDGRVAAIREGLDDKGFKNVPIMSYAVKYASKFYGPFREAAGSAPSFGDRKTYQMDPHNVREAMREAMYDEEEGADILMVKPALSYLDVIKELSYNTNLPVATYSVSGEYSMIKNAGKAGLIDEYGIMCETTASMFRAGADIVITYYAMEAADAIVKGDIG